MWIDVCFIVVTSIYFQIVSPPLGPTEQILMEEQFRYEQSFMETWEPAGKLVTEEEVHCEWRYIDLGTEGVNIESQRRSGSDRSRRSISEKPWLDSEAKRGR